MSAVDVIETRVFATGSGAEWWAMFLKNQEPTGRISVISDSLGGGVRRVECDDRTHAEWWIENAVINGIPRSALKLR